MLCEDLQLICTQQSLLLLSAPALHMQSALPRAELGAGLYLPLYDTILSSTGVLLQGRKNTTAPQ